MTLTELCSRGRARASAATSFTSARHFAAPPALSPERTPRRWLPIPIPTPEASPSPRPGWQDVEKWRGRSGDFPEVTGCSALVKTLRRALRTPPGGRPTQPAFWRKAISRSGKLAGFLSPEEACEVLSTLAEARLQWRGDPTATRGLQQFASHAAEEVGSFTPAQMSELAGALAQLGFLHQDLMSALSRTVENTILADRGRLSNEAAVGILSAFHRLSLLDEPLMKCMSKLLCRRIIREPPTAQQTAGIVVAYAELRVRDLALFNATTLALCRPGAVEELSWVELADVSVGYASLRLSSASLFGHIRRRLCDSSGVIDDAGEEAADEEELDAGSSRAFPLVPATSPLHALLDSLEAAEPLPPILPLPPRVVTRFLEAQIHLGRYTVQDAAPLLPHLAHSGGGPGGRPSVELASLLLVFLGRGGHAWPWLWRRAVAGALLGGEGADSERLLPGHTLLPLAEAFRAQIELLRPLTKPNMALQAEDDDDIFATPAVLAAHLQALAGGLVRLWSVLGQQSRCFSDLELREATLSAAPRLLAAQEILGAAIGSRAVHAGAADVGAALERAAARAARQLGAELLRRRLASGEELRELLGRCGVPQAQLAEDVRLLAEDSISL